MSGYYGRDQFLQAAHQQRALLVGERQQAEQTYAQHRQALQGVHASKNAAYMDLGNALLPELTQPWVDRAVALVGFQPWQTQSPVRTVAASLSELARRRAEIEQNPRFRDREMLTHPRTGSLARAMAETSEMLAPWQDVLARGEHPRMDRLVAEGYGTPAYKVGFWRLSHFEDHAAAESILSHFPGKTFPEVAAEVLRGRETVSTLEGELARLQGEAAAVETLVREHQHVGQQLVHLPGTATAAARHRLCEHVMTSPPATMTAMLARDPTTQNLYLRVSGLSHKMDYLNAVASQFTTALAEKLDTDIAKLDRDIVKYQSPRKANAMFPAEVFERRFADRRPRYEKHWARYQRSYTTIYQYDDYRQASLFEDFLWWDVMTRGRVDGRYIPQVNSWYSARPGYVYVAPERDADDDADAAAALAMGERDGDPTYTSDHS
jgi:hypothetical protein